MPNNVDAPLAKGPAIQNVTTPFDQALECVRGKIEPSVSFAVGQVVDATGKETYSEGGSGKILSQGAGEMVQSALYRAGVTVVNRRDPNISVVETQWGIRDIKQQTPTNFYVSGSINSLDFIPGGGVEFDFGGVGVGKRQNRILIALDLSLTDAFTGRIVANVPLQKQIFTEEFRVGGDRFFDTTLISLSAGGMKREAVHFAMRQMLNFATLELLGQLMSEENYSSCRGIVASMDGNTSVSNRREDLRHVVLAAMNRNTAEPLQATKPPKPTPAAQAPKPPAKITPALRKQMEKATMFAGRALVSAQAAKSAKDAVEARSHAREAQQYAAVAIQALKTAAAGGLTGAEGDAVALLVERALVEVQLSEQLVRKKEAAAASQPSESDPGGDTGLRPKDTDNGPDSGVPPTGSLRDSRIKGLPH
ncbi:CsgG/HfaB family protein [Phaeobacter gallaeciensis]|uniref:CsgG/HfaB family protein n=1 Tax=Phaeobacter gallaeciensis TaxID=60890 RepID=UPI00237F5931|nr:CsgG/HfaB family protein [Phaeobacter gallaeciensis]MDE4063743.1 CsgG/HfaB family protein [Phaeobacter gallaeciensis]MDE4126757.1 CsgG/HfaB family protein [Phaeobacter gallaeciensis]MDE4131243.1 CsgG/HfaB family protein [Phaeobacter gallaeciensis]